MKLKKFSSQFQSWLGLPALKTVSSPVENITLGKQALKILIDQYMLIYRACKKTNINVNEAFCLFVYTIGRLRTYLLCTVPYLT